MTSAHAPSTGGIHSMSVSAAIRNGRGRWSPRPLGAGIRLLPGAFFVTYLTATVLLFAFGPWPWPVQDGTILYSFLAVAHLSLFLGFLSAASGTPRAYGRRFVIPRFLTLSNLVNLLLLAPTLFARTGSPVPNVAAALADPGAAYSASLELRAGALFVVVEYVRILLAPVLAAAIPLTIYYWRSLHMWTRLLGVCTILGTVITYIAMGANKAIADIVLIAPWLIVASHVAGFRRLKGRSVLMWSTLVVIGLLLFFAFFTAGALTRRGSGARVGFFPFVNIYADQQNLLVRWLPEEPRAGANSLISYLTQGYYALYLALDEPFVPMFGAGNSMFVQRNIARLLNRPDLETLTYPVRIEPRGWSALGQWSSIYPWLASDVSFPGVLILVFVIGRLYAQSWLDALNGGNPFAIVMFSMFTVMIYYFPANNQVLQTGESFVAFFTLLAAWRLTRGNAPRQGTAS